MGVNAQLEAHGLSFQTTCMDGEGIPATPWSGRHTRFRHDSGRPPLPARAISPTGNSRPSLTVKTLS